MNGYPHEKAIETAAAATGNTPATVEKGYKNGSPAAYAKNKADLAAAKNAYDGVNELMKGYTKAKACATVAAQAGNGTKGSQISQLYDSVKELMKGYSKDKACATVASQAGTGATGADVSNLYDSVQELMNGYDKDKACATVYPISTTAFRSL